MIAAARPTDREQNADFMCALEDGHEHRVHYAENADKYGQQRCAPAHRFHETKSFGVTQVFAHCHSANFGHRLLNLLREFLNLLLGCPRRRANINGVDLVRRADDLLQQRQRKNDRTIFHERAALHDAYDL